MKTTIAFAALLAALAAPGPALARIGLPDSPHAEGIARDVLERLWCAEIFPIETQWLERDGEPERAAAYRADTGWLRSTALSQLRLDGVEAGHAAALRAGYEQKAGWELDGDAYHRALHECDAAFSEVGADGVTGMIPAAQPDPLDAYGAWLDGDYDTALALWRQLAEDGDLDAAFMLAESHLQGLGVDADRGLALHWYRFAAEHGHLEAQFALGEQHALQGERRWPDDGAARDFVEAAHWLRMAAERGHAPARHWLGRMAVSGAGMPEDEEAAREWWTLAAAQGYRESYDTLGAFGYPVPDELAAQWAVFDVARNVFHASARRHGPELLQPFAEAGHMEAQFIVGTMYLTRRERTSDLDDAERWLRAAQLQGDRRARHLLMELSLGRSGYDAPRAPEGDLAACYQGGEDALAACARVIASPDADDRMRREAHHWRAEYLQFTDAAEEDAVAAYGDALAIDPDHVPSLLGRAGALLALDDPARALADLDRAVALGADWTARLMRARAHRALGDADEAIADFRRVLAENPQSYAAREALLELGAGPQ